MVNINFFVQLYPLKCQRFSFISSLFHYLLNIFPEYLSIIFCTYFIRDSPKASTCRLHFAHEYTALPAHNIQELVIACYMMLSGGQNAESGHLCRKTRDFLLILRSKQQNHQSSIQNVAISCQYVLFVLQFRWFFGL